MKNLAKQFEFYRRLARERYLQNFVFIHINKTGGSSIQKALAIRHEHKTALEKRRELGLKVWNRKFCFAFVRNPWDKVVSHYHFRVMTDQTGLRQGNVRFEEWVRLAYGENAVQYYDNPKMFLPQMDWISDETGRVLVNFIGRFERLQDDFELVCANIGLPGVVLPHVKKSERGSYRYYYDDESREVVRRWFQKDIEHLGYQF